MKKIYYGCLCLLYATLIAVPYHSYCQFGNKQFLADNIIDEKFELAVDLNQDGYMDMIFLRFDRSLEYSTYEPNGGTHIVKINDGNNNFIEEHEIKYDKNGWHKIVPEDIDNDGKLDLVVLNTNNKVTWLRNQGDYNFTWRYEMGKFSSKYYNSFVIGDINNDGIKDFVFTEVGNNSFIKVNFGTNEGKFGNTTVIKDFGESWKEANMEIIENFDDTPYNELVAEVDGSIVIYSYENGNFEETVVKKVVDYTDGEYLNYQSTDINNDGLMDIICVYRNWEEAILYNNPNGVVIFKNKDSLAFEESMVDNSYSDEDYNTMEYDLIDVDSDGDLDIVDKKDRLDYEYYNHYKDLNRILIHTNQGDGNFGVGEDIARNKELVNTHTLKSKVSALLLESPKGLTEMTLNGKTWKNALIYKSENKINFDYYGIEMDAAALSQKNYKDIFVGNDQVSWFSSVNKFEQTVIDFDIPNVNTLAAVDLAKDGNTWVAIGTEGEYYEEFNASYKYENAAFSDPLRFPACNFVLGDFNGDRFQDVVGRNQYLEREITISFNNGKGEFDKYKDLNLDEYDVKGVANFNQNSNDDIVLNNWESKIKIIEYNEGEIITLFEADYEILDQFPDINGDGYPDLIGLSEDQMYIYWYKNGGDGKSFEKQTLTQINEVTDNLNFLDIDVDGDIDILASLPNDGDKLAWYENIEGKFSEPKETGYKAKLIFPDDLDFDGDPDLVIVDGTELFILENLTPGEAETPLTLTLSSAEYYQKDTVSVSLKAKDFAEINALAFSLTWDAEVLSFVSVKAEGLEQVSLSDDEVSASKLGLNWENESESGKSLKDNTTLLTLRFVANGQENDSTTIVFSDDPVTQQASNAKGETVLLETTAGKVRILKSQAPKDIKLSAATIEENQPKGTLIGKLSTSDDDKTGSFTYEFTDGDGNDDNNAFSIKNGDELVSVAAFDYEDKNSYNIRIKSTDSRDKSYEKAFVIKIADVDETNNHAPTNIVLSASAIDENLEAGALVAVMTTTDEDKEDTHTYSLVEGEGSEGNRYFVIKKDTLHTLSRFDYEQQSEISIRLEVADHKGGTYQKSFIISVEDVEDDANEAPTAINLSSTTVDENAAVGTLIGTFTATDNDDTAFTYSLVAGDGGAGNGQFMIKEDQLLTAASFDYEVRDTYTIRVKVDDGRGGTFSELFRISVNDLEDDMNNVPTDIMLSNNTIEEEKEAGTLIGALSTNDKDSGDDHLYALVSGSSNNDNALFEIRENQLLSAAAFDFEDRHLFIIRVQTDDGKGGTFAKDFLIEIADKEETAVPEELKLSGSSVQENSSKSTLVGDLSSNDNSFTYGLVSGEGDTDNDLFMVSGNQLFTNAVFDYETQTSYSIRIAVSNDGGESYEQTFTITIEDQPENIAPVVAHEIADQAAVVNEAFSLTLSDVFSDEEGDSLRYKVTTQGGNALPGWLSLDAESMTLSGTPTAAGEITIVVTATDIRDASASDDFVLTVEGVTAIGDEVRAFCKVYPNPGSHFILIEYQEQVPVHARYRLIDDTGKTMKEWLPGKASVLKLDITDITQGVYQLLLITDDRVNAFRILKE